MTATVQPVHHANTAAASPAGPSPADRGLLAPRRAALIAGIGYVALFVLAMFGNFFVFEAMIVPGDASATAANIADDPGLFRRGIVAFLAIFVIDVAVAWALFVVFRDRDRDLSLVSAWFRLAYTVMLGVGLAFMVQALQLVDGPSATTGLSDGAREAQALVALDTFEAAWLIGLVAFGFHLVLLGALMLRGRRGPRALAVLLVVAGVAYNVDTLAHFLMGTYEDHAASFLAMVAVPSVIAEGWFGLWLLTRAGRRDQAPV